MQQEQKISIILASFNADKYIEEALNSIIRQDYNNYELIIIDGKSKDKTVEIIKKYTNHIAFWISEPDKGIYSAWNKGLRKASGDWVMFLGCDDLLLPKSLSKYSKFINTLPLGVEYVSSKVKMIDEDKNALRIKGWGWEWPRFLREMTVAHPGSLHSRALFKKYGFFNTDYKIVGDYELLLRPKEKLKSAFLDEVTVLMRENGASDNVKALKEQYKASVNTGGFSKIKALVNVFAIFNKFKIRKILRKIGINAYLRK